MATTQSPTQSPTPTKVVTKPMDFYNALKEIMNGHKVTKLEWKNNEYYGILDDTRLKLHQPDGQLYDWILTDGDICGNDFIVLSL